MSVDADVKSVEAHLWLFRLGRVTQLERDRRYDAIRCSRTALIWAFCSFGWTLPLMTTSLPRDALVVVGVVPLLCFLLTTGAYYAFAQTNKKLADEAAEIRTRIENEYGFRAAVEERTKSRLL